MAWDGQELSRKERHLKLSDGLDGMWDPALAIGTSRALRNSRRLAASWEKERMNGTTIKKVIGTWQSRDGLLLGREASHCWRLPPIYYRFEHLDYRIPRGTNMTKWSNNLHN